MSASEENAVQYFVFAWIV